MASSGYYTMHLTKDIMVFVRMFHPMHFFQTRKSKIGALFFLKKDTNLGGKSNTYETLIKFQIQIVTTKGKNRK